MSKFAKHSSRPGGKGNSGSYRSPLDGANTPKKRKVKTSSNKK